MILLAFTKEELSSYPSELSIGEINGVPGRKRQHFLSILDRYYAKITN